MTGASGSFSNSAISGIGADAAVPSPEDAVRRPRSRVRGCRGPARSPRTRPSRKWTPNGDLVILVQGANDWICFPGNENEIGNVPMCCDPMGLQWMRDAMAGKPKPTNTAPGLIYMLCGATQHSNTDAADHTSPAIPIGPHWMILWPYDAARDGLPAPSAMRAHG